jgi:hypothetical protein
MRKDEFSRAERRWSERRDIFTERRRRRRFPWRATLLVLALGAAALALSRSDLDGLLAGLSSLWPDASEPQPKSDPNRLPLLPLPPHPSGR